MEIEGIRFLAVFVAFLCVVAEGNRKIAESFVRNGVSWDFQEFDGVTGAQACCYHGKELRDSAEVVCDSTLSRKKTLPKAIADLPPTKKKTILNCLRQKNLPLQKLRLKEESQFHKKYEFLFGRSSIPRRCLRRRLQNRVLTTNVPTPGPNSSMSPISQPPSSAEGPEPYSPPYYSTSPSPSDSDYTPQLPKNLLPVSPESDHKNSKYLLAAIIACSMSGFALLFVSLICCMKKSRTSTVPNDGQRDEKPLLNFCASDISAGSSQKSNSVGNPNVNKDFKANSTICKSALAIHDSSQAESRPQAERSEKTNAALPLPPGRTEQQPPLPRAPPPPPPKPSTPVPAPAPAPPPPPKVRRPPNSAMPGNLLKPAHLRGSSSTDEGSEPSTESEAPKTKLKPFFWDKVLANPDHSMVWHEIKAGSFQFNEEMMENLFGYVPADKNKNENRRDAPVFESPQFIQIIDPKKSQNLAILLKALNVTTEEVFDALKEGNELPAELIQTLLKMAPTTEEELKLRLYSGDVSHLGPAERFLKVIVEIPFAFKRLESLLFLSTYQEEVSSVKDCFATLEVACKELRNNRLFLKLLEAVLKTGNRMNDGTYRGGAQAFKLDTLLKLSDVKGTDGKTTLLHFVVQEIIRSEGLRAARRLRESQSMSSVKTEDLIEDSSSETDEYHRTLGLQVVSGLSNELENVRKAALIDTENLSSSVFKIGQSLVRTRDFLETEMKGLDDETEFTDALSSFVRHSESNVTWLLEEEKRIMSLVKSTGDYFYGHAGKDDSLRLFVIVRDFLVMVEKACKDVKNSAKLPSKAPRKESLTTSPSQEPHQDPPPDTHQRLFPAVRERQTDDELSSDDES
ncbi:formin-like protein 3-like [Dorcoceras hygrometricum]|uniref:Formin-like protein n=1 Tax=Dorcoceras hygrometricum TaxID=472368 RepID=A0A2Z7A1E3_9LAMI|nr:formin-like protein 3-like [Dorcoceras hygrometricum]